MDGIIVINKPKGYTSRDVVNIVGKALHTTQIGHTGTLDPMATGVLVLCVGKATKMVELLTSESKEYEVELKLGFETDTLDMEGIVLREENVPNLTKEKIEETLNQFLGFQKQEVPIYSAIKVNGKKLYEYARNNQAVELPIKDITIYDIELISYQKDTIRFKTYVSKGTYIRSLVRDIAYKLGTVGTMTALNRTKQGMFSIEDAYTIEDIKNNAYKIQKIEESLPIIKIQVEDETIFKIKNGQILDRFFKDDMAMLMDSHHHPLAIYKTYEKDTKKVKPYKVF